MKILTTYENRLPNTQADAEVVVNTAAALMNLGHQVILASQGPRPAKPERVRTHEISAYFEAPPIPVRPILERDEWVPRSLFLERAVLHTAQVARLPTSDEANNADIILTRHLALALACLAQGHHVAYDHYRPWGEQIPAMKPLLRAMFRHPCFVGVIAHSHWTRNSYARLGLASQKSVVCHNGHRPLRPEERMSKSAARAQLGLNAGPLVIYTGRVNHKKGLDVVLAMASLLPNVHFLWVGCEGHPLERQARHLANLTLVPWCRSSVVSSYLIAADVILVPPSSEPLYVYGSTVLPLKLFRYLDMRQPIFAGATPDICEILNQDNACLVPPDAPRIAASSLHALLSDPKRRQRLGAGAATTASGFSWHQRAQRITVFLERRKRQLSAE